MPAIFLFFLFLSASFAQPAQAGFGISPPYVKTNKPIFPGSKFEQRITLVRSSATAGMQAEVTVNAPEIANWISIDKGLVFDLPQDQLKIPMNVIVDVPDSAEIGNYKGYINIRITPKNSSNEGGVAIALGARVDIDLTITNEEFVDFNVRTVNINDFEMLGFPWKYRIFSMFFHRINVAMLIENTGNTKVAPTRVHLDVYDITEKNILASYDDTKIKKVEPFRTMTTSASFPTKLGEGRYWGHVKVYKDNDVLYKNKIAFTIHPHGSLNAGTKLGIWPWLMLAAMFLLLCLVLIALYKVKIWIYIGALIYLLAWPLRKIWHFSRSAQKSFARKFWSWMHKKSSQYNSENSKNKDN